MRRRRPRESQVHACGQISATRLPRRECACLVRPGTVQRNWPHQSGLSQRKLTIRLCRYAPLKHARIFLRIIGTRIPAESIPTMRTAIVKSLLIQAVLQDLALRCFLTSVGGVVNQVRGRRAVGAPVKRSRRNQATFGPAFMVCRSLIGPPEKPMNESELRIIVRHGRAQFAARVICIPAPCDCAFSTASTRRKPDCTGRCRY